MHFVTHLHDNSGSSCYSMHASSHLFVHLLIINSTITSHPGFRSSERARHVQAWEWVQKALVIGKQLKDWTIQSNALRGAVVTKPMCCDPACYIRIQPYERREQLKSVWHCNCPHCPAGHLPIIICTSGMVLMTCNA